jgi:CcmD family protein
MDGLGFLGIAFLALWLVIAAYLLRVTRKQRALERRLEELQNRENKD